VCSLSRAYFFSLSLPPSLTPSLLHPSLPPSKSPFSPSFPPFSFFLPYTLTRYTPTNTATHTTHTHTHTHTSLTGTAVEVAEAATASAGGGGHALGGLEEMSHAGRDLLCRTSHPPTPSTLAPAALEKNKNNSPGPVTRTPPTSAQSSAYTCAAIGK
jgi:hypothetical protein